MVLHQCNEQSRASWMKSASPPVQSMCVRGVSTLQLHWQTGRLRQVKFAGGRYHSYVRAIRAVPGVKWAAHRVQSCGLIVHPRDRTISRFTASAVNKVSIRTSASKKWPYISTQTTNTAVLQSNLISSPISQNFSLYSQFLTSASLRQ